MTAPEERETATPAPLAGRRGRVPADTFSNRLILARAMAGHISIREACELTGLNRGSWQGWERGLRPRDILDAAQRIAASLDVDEHWLLFGGPLAGPRGMPSDGQETLRRRYSAVAARPTDSRPKGRPDGGQRPQAPSRPEQRRPVRLSAQV
jgi:hypothetical protein